MEARTIEIRQGTIRIRDPRAELTVVALKAGLLLHGAGLIAVIAAATAFEAFNAWLIAAAALYALGLVSALGSLASVFHFAGSAELILHRVWNEYREGRVAVNDLFRLVTPPYPKKSDPGPVFCWLAGLFFTTACLLLALGLADMMRQIPLVS